MICPSCEGRELEQDMVNVGVGEVPCGPLSCPDCHWVDGEPVPTRAEMHQAISGLMGVYIAAHTWRHDPPSIGDAVDDLLRAIDEADKVFEAGQAFEAKP